VEITRPLFPCFPEKNFVTGAEGRKKSPRRKKEEKKGRRSKIKKKPMGGQ